MTWTEIAWIFHMKEGRDGRNHKPEEIIDKLREPEIALAEGGTVVDAGLSPKFPPFRSRVSSPSDAHDWA